MTFKWVWIQLYIASLVLHPPNSSWLSKGTGEVRGDSRNLLTFCTSFYVVCFKVQKNPRWWSTSPNTRFKSGSPKWRWAHWEACSAPCCRAVRSGESQKRPAAARSSSTGLALSSVTWTCGYPGLWLVVWFQLGFLILHMWSCRDCKYLFLFLFLQQK